MLEALADALAQVARAATLELESRAAEGAREAPHVQVHVQVVLHVAEARADPAADVALPARVDPPSLLVNVPLYSVANAVPEVRRLLNVAQAELIWSQFPQLSIDILYLCPVSYTHLTLPTNREV